jgi:2-polyprenyl-3-methyl-5-hydroxy-6-metoxy-1,4-benzoquinol methylase
MTTTERTSIVESRSQYWEWTSATEAPNHRYLAPAVLRMLGPPGGRRLLDVGCGNGALTAKLAAAGFEVTGVDFEPHGIEHARAAHPGIEFLWHDVSNPLPAAMLGRFDVVTSAEMIEHLFLPRDLFARAREALGGRGELLVTTPNHGYTKNLAMALLDRFDVHVQALSDYGHIKFFSKRTLAQMATECGFTPVSWARAGRVPPIAASMLMRAELRPRTAPPLAAGGRDARHESGGC